MVDYTLPKGQRLHPDVARARIQDPPEFAAKACSVSSRRIRSAPPHL
jgi:hypothetical protein